tara:strand:- start:648 stop:1766 length:1119 start_codon:yes stop_codon:yes gene_type:complete
MPPTVEQLDDITIDEDSGDIQIDLTGLSSGVGETQSFVAEVFVSNEDLLTPELTHTTSAGTGSLALSFPEHAFGTTSIVLQLMDAGYDQDLATLEDNQFFVEEFAVIVNQINDDPVASDGLYHLEDNQTLTPEYDNDLYSLVEDPDVDRLVFTQVTAPEYGQLILRDGGTFEYVPDENFNRVDSFQYKVSDGTVTTAPQLVTIEMVTDYLWFNGSSPGDVNDDGHLVPMDALSVINRLNAGEGGDLPAERENGMQAPFWDASRDNKFSPIDALVVINELNEAIGGEAEAEGESWPYHVDHVLTQDSGAVSSDEPMVENSLDVPLLKNITMELSRTIALLVTDLELIRDEHLLAVADEGEAFNLLSDEQEIWL